MLGGYQKYLQISPGHHVSVSEPLRVSLWTIPWKVTPDWKLDHRFSLVWKPAESKNIYIYWNPGEVKTPLPGSGSQDYCVQGLNTTFNEQGWRVIIVVVHMGCSSGSAQEKGKTGWNSVITKKIDGFEQGWRVIIVVVHMGCSSESAQEKGKTGWNSVITKTNWWFWTRVESNYSSCTFGLQQWKRSGKRKDRMKLSYHKKNWWFWTRLESNYSSCTYGLQQWKRSGKRKDRMKLSYHKKKLMVLNKGRE